MKQFQLKISFYSFQFEALGKVILSVACFSVIAIYVSVRLDKF